MIATPERPVAYHQFLAGKISGIQKKGISVSKEAVNPILFPFQKDVVVWAAWRGCCAVFLDTGMGKTLVQVEWARLMGENALIIAPLSVARQTVREAQKIGVEVRYVRDQSEIKADHRIWITNYEMAERFDFSAFGSVVLDESSILKAIGGKTRRKLIDLCSGVKYRLCCTATPAPNDYTEIGNHAEFLGICTVSEMLATYFVNANKEHTIIVGDRLYRKKGSNAGGTEWRIKHHAEEPFFRWLSTWAISMTKPSDLGYADDGFILPELKISTTFVHADYTPEDQLLFTGLHGISDRADVRKKTIERRLDALKVIIGESKEQWIVWCGLDDESRMVSEILPGSVEVKGSDDPEEKAKAFEEFQDRKHRILVTKPRIGGFGMNFQNARNMVFMGLNDSWEAYYQCIRREWRFGQKKPVNVHIVMSEIEREIYQNVMRKDLMAKRLRNKLIERIRDYEMGELNMKTSIMEDYDENITEGEGWKIMLGDSCKRLAEIGENTVDMSVYSPPFADLYTYSASERDLGNSRSWDQFFSHYKFIIAEVLRVTKPGRLTCVHTSDIPAMAMRDGYIGVRDFPGAVIRAYEEGGWVFTGRAFVQKNPQAQAIRTKSKALLFTQMRKDSSDSRPALVDQILLFKKNGENAVPICPVKNGEMDNEIWIQWAHGIWLGIQETDTLQFREARADDDEKHLCPLQLGVIERCIKLYSNPGETILSPFAGIGSEGYVAVKNRRNFIGIELKKEYWQIAVKNLKAAEAENEDLFSVAETLNAQ